MKLQKIYLYIQRVYVTIMMSIVSRGLSALTRIDEESIKEIKALPVNYIIEMMVLNGPGFKIRTLGEGNLEVLNKTQCKVDLSIKLKHLSHAFLILSFQEGTTEAFSKDRMIIDGELSNAVRLVRLLNKLESIILPKFIAKRAVKRYPENLGYIEKIIKAVRIYVLVIKHLIIGS